MTSKTQDIWLLVGLGIMGYWTARIAHGQLVAVRTATEVTQEHKPRHDILSQRTEDALKLQTLDHLTQSANQDIWAAAVKIITERATQSAALDLIVQDIGGKDIDRRDKALTSLLYLRTHKVLTPTYNMFKALIDCLSGWLPAVCPVTPYRSQPERDAVKILNLLLQHNVTLALQAGIVVRWLSHCCFDPDDKSEARRKQAIQEMRRWHYNDVDMCSIIITLFNHEQAREELLSHGLWDRDADKKEASDGTQEIIWQVQGNIPDLIFDGVNTGPIMRRGRRVREESIEEQALRRRRREAMVLGQDGRAVERDDIIGQDNEPRDEDLEQRNAVDEAAQAPAEGIQTWWNWRPWSILRATLVEEF